MGGRGGQDGRAGAPRAHRGPLQAGLLESSPGSPDWVVRDRASPRSAGGHAPHAPRPGARGKPGPGSRSLSAAASASQVSSLSGPVAQVRPQQRNQDVKYLSKCLGAGGIRVGRAPEPNAGKRSPAAPPCRARAVAGHPRGRVAALPGPAPAVSAPRPRKRVPKSKAGAKGVCRAASSTGRVDCASPRALLR